MEIIGPEEIRRLNPFLDTAGVIAGAWTLDDGHVDPAGCCNAMAIAARNLGATIIRYNRVIDINQQANGEWSVITEHGNITCEHVVNAGGCYAARIGAWVGLNIPIFNIKHQYLVTEPIQEFIDREEEIPVMRDPYSNAYYRQEQKSALIGIYERSNWREAWADSSGQAWTAENELFAPEYEPIMPWLERVMERMPIFGDAGIIRVVNGASPRSPDHNPLLGPAPGLRNFWLSCGASIGIAQGAGAGKYLAQLMVHGETEINMVRVDPRRFGPFAEKNDQPVDLLAPHPCTINSRPRVVFIWKYLAGSAPNGFRRTAALKIIAFVTTTSFKSSPPSARRCGNAWACGIYPASPNMMSPVPMPKRFSTG
jgi:dimethylglycine dehydrogenase